MIVSVSTDGHYAVSSHLNGEIILWDITRKTHQLIANNANIYSAYFIKNSDEFMWQDQNNQVHIQNVQGSVVLNFQNPFPVYGQVMSPDHQHYFAANQRWDLYSGYGAQQKQIKSAYDVNGFLGSGKLFNLILSNNNQLLLTSGDSINCYDEVPLSVGINTKQAARLGYDVGFINASLLEGVVLWNVATGKPLYKLPGNEVKTIATFSPDDQYVVSGDENEFLMIWRPQNGKRFLNVSDTLLDLPTDIDESILRNHINSILALKFIDADHYLRFTNRSFNYAILYSIHNSNPLKFVALGNYPVPAVNDFSRDEAIDTAPAAHILVMGLATGSGIIVYRYDPGACNLTKIWAADGPRSKRVAD